MHEQTESHQVCHMTNFKRMEIYACIMIGLRVEHTPEEYKKRQSTQLRIASPKVSTIDKPTDQPTNFSYHKQVIKSPNINLNGLLVYFFPYISPPLHTSCR